MSSTSSSDAPSPVSEPSSASVAPQPTSSDPSKPPSPNQPPSMRMESDAPLYRDEDDQLRYRDFADAVARIIDEEQTSTPLTIGISAPWGAGKSTLVNFIARRLHDWPTQRDQTPHIVMWFNAWMNDAAIDLSAAFTADVARHANRYRSLWRRLLLPLPSSMLSPSDRARRARRLVLLSFIVALATFPISYHIFQLKAASSAKAIGVYGSGLAIWFTLGASFLYAQRVIASGIRSVASFIDEPSGSAGLGSMSEVRDALGKLIKQSIGNSPARRFVIIVEDLERCAPPKAVDVCEVASQLLGHPGVVCILVGDMNVISASAEIKYKEIADKFSQADGNVGKKYGRFFLEKIVQFQIELPSLSRGETGAITQKSIRDPAPSPTGDADDLPEKRARSFVGRNLRLLLGSSQNDPTVGLGLLVAGILLVVSSTWSFSIGSSVVATTLLVVAVVLFYLGYFILFFTWYRFRRRQRRQRRVDEAVVKVIEDEEITTLTEELTFSELVPLLRDKAKAKLSRTPSDSDSMWQIYKGDELLRHRLQQSVSNDDGLRIQAEQGIANFLPELPRATKRLINRLRFLLVIAFTRELLKPDSLQPTMIGKWAVFLERWPDLASQVVRSPSFMSVLESTASGEANSMTVLLTSKSIYADENQLSEFLSSYPSMGSVAETLVHLNSHPAASPIP